MEKVCLALPPVGVCFADSLDGLEDVAVYHGASYCDAVRLATEGRELVVAPGSIEVCKWSPVVLGIKEPGSDFESRLGPRVEGGPAAVYLAPLDLFRPGLEPDVVIIRGSRGQVDSVAEMLGPGALTQRYRGRFDKSALGAGDTGVSIKALVTNGVNRALARLSRSEAFDRIIRRAFRSERLTTALEALIKRTMASMSICRNSTVIPFTEGAGNISFFCTGGVAWGGNSPYHVTSGFPYRALREHLDRLDYPITWEVRQR